jgi:CHAT domain-containing protein/tetratricopeptide (TPR) repeat protein
MNLAQAQPASDLYDQGNDLYYEGRYREAEKLFLNALELYENQFGREHKETLRLINRLGRTYSQLRENEKALHFLQEAFVITNKLYGSESAESAYCLIDIGHSYAQMYEPENANEAYNKALAIIEKTHGKESSRTANVLMNIGSAYHKKGDYLDAERYYLRAFEIFSKVSEPDSEDFNRIYSNMGYMYRKKGDLEKALDFGMKALEIKLKNYEQAHPSVGKYYRNIGRVYEEMNRMEEALPYMQRAVEITESSLGSDHPQTAGSFNELAHIYAGMRQYDTALLLYQKGNRLLEKALPADHPYVVAGYFNIALIYNETGQLDHALEYYRIALAKLLTRSYRPGNLIAQTRNDMASVFFQQKALDSALVYCQMALAEISKNFLFHGDNLYNNPSIDEVQAQTQFLRILANKASILEEHYKQDITDEINLLQSLNTILLAVSLIEEIRLGYQSESSRQYLSTGTAGIFRTGVRVAMELYKKTGDQKYLWQAFELSEKSKASILWRSLNEGSALGAAGIPEQEQETIASFEQRIATFEEELSQSDEETDDDKTASLRSKLFDVKLEYSRHLTYLENSYPAFYGLRYAPSVVDQERLTRKLSDSDMALINYFYDDDSMFIFLLGKKGVQGFVQPFTIDLAGTVKNVREFEIAMLLSSGSEAVHQAYLQHLQDLYSQLIKPVRDELQDIKRLVVIPHGIIHYLPFEMLVEEVNGPDFRNQPYLLHDFIIQYAWSAALWEKEIPYTSVPRLTYAGFAPSFNFKGSEDEINNKYRSALSNLTFSVQEIADAQTLFGGRVFNDESATKEAFRLYAPTSRILHLATHAIVDNERSLQSGLAFAEEPGSHGDQFLYAHEIYNLKLSAEMAVMSACNTAYGELAEGEGVMSLGRAFFHAGCRSVIMSQWPANDRTTYGLMYQFYQLIAQGQHKDEALRNAKLAHLANADALTAHPYFWAGMIAVGDMRPMPKGKITNKWIWALSGLIIIGLAVLVFKLRA